MEHKKFGALTSSQDPNEIANKVKGVILMSSSIIIFLAAKFFGIQLSATDITSLATMIGAVAGAVWAIYGTVLHLIAWFYETRSRQN